MKADEYRKMTKKKQKAQIGIKWKMLAILLMFVILIVLTLWFFQIQMLSYFYQTAKFNELEDFSEAINTGLEDPLAVREIIVAHGEKNYMDIWVFEVDKDNNALDTIVTVNGSADVFMPFLTKKMPIFYEKAVENGGRYIAMISKDHYNNKLELRVFKDNMGDMDTYPIVSGSVGNVNAICVNIYELNNRQFVLVQKSDFTPMNSLVNTLQNQFTITGVFLFVFALIFASILSKFITNPLVKMNESAKRLAKGEYSAQFSGSGYREINELADTLNYAAEELSQNDRLQKDLIANVSHDLRTPLTMIKGYSEIMRDIPGENTPENVQVIIDESARLAELVNDMLDLSKIQSGSRLPEFREFCFTDVVRDTLSRYEKLKMQEGYNITFSADKDVNVMADSVMILQVVYNLINNAINYTGEDKRVLVKQTVNENVVRLSVTDTGDGISEEDIPRIWDRYYKVDKVHKRATVGTGLGLSIVKGILETHNASYGVQSTPGYGSTFWFELNVFDSSTYEDDY